MLLVTMYTERQKEAGTERMANGDADVKAMKFTATQSLVKSRAIAVAQ